MLEYMYYINIYRYIILYKKNSNCNSSGWICNNVQNLWFFLHKNEACYFKSDCTISKSQIRKFDYHIITFFWYNSYINKTMSCIGFTSSMRKIYNNMLFDMCKDLRKTIAKRVCPAMKILDNMNNEQRVGEQMNKP